MKIFVMDYCGFLISYNLDCSPNVESTTTTGQENSDDNSNDEKFPVKVVQHPEETCQREIDILQKIFPQKDKVWQFHLQPRFRNA